MYMAFFKAGKKSAFLRKMTFPGKKSNFHFTFFYSLLTVRTCMENSWQVLKKN